MNPRGRLNGVERAAGRTYGEPSAAEGCRWERDVERWTEWRAGLRTPHPAVLDLTHEPDPIYPAPPREVNSDRWRAALDALACFSARVARRIGADDHLDDVTEDARYLTERHAARWSAFMVRPGEPLPWFFSEAAPPYPPDPEADALLSAIGLFATGRSATAADANAVQELFERARERCSS